MKTINCLIIAFSALAIYPAQAQVFTAEPSANPPHTSKMYLDRDHDGFGDANSPVILQNAQRGFSANAEDFNDYDASVFPGALDICDGIDNDHNGMVDDQPFSATTFPANNLIIDEGTRLPLYCTATGNGFIYQWKCNGELLVNEHDSFIDVFRSGIYSVHVLTPGGCEADTPEIHIIVIPAATSDFDSADFSNVNAQPRR